MELIRYMHTYCLPPRKLPPTNLAEVKHQHFHSPSKRAKPDCPLQKDSCPSRSCHTSAGYKPPRAPSSNFSILKELLARDLPCDVSKPYRLAKPVYASLTGSYPSKSPRVPPLEIMGSSEMCKSTGKMPPPVKTEPRQCPKTEPEAKKETSCSIEEDGAKQVTHPVQLTSTKVNRKQESSIYAVRRSKRLNPELSVWLSFLDESPPDPAVSPDAAGNKFASIEPTPCPALQNFDTEAPAAEVEVSGVDEVDSGCQSLPMELQTPSPESSRDSEACETSENQCCPFLHKTGMEESRTTVLPVPHCIWTQM